MRRYIRGGWSRRRAVGLVLCHVRVLGGLALEEFGDEVGLCCAVRRSDVDASKEVFELGNLERFPITHQFTLATTISESTNSLDSMVTKRDTRDANKDALDAFTV